jgi:thiamine-monophosphate kinase
VIDPGIPIGDIGERGLLRHLRSRIPGGPGVVLGVGDDAAALETGPLTLVTTDVLVEGVHFLRDWTPPRLLGRKALTINLSDIAAMAGVPRHATVSLCLPSDLPMGFLDGFYDGLLERAAETGVNLVGGNLSASGGPMVVDVTLLGQGDRLLTRAGAQSGDLLVVTGTLGAASLGLRLLRKGARLDEDGNLAASGPWGEASAGAVRHCLRAQLDPAPPLAFARALAEKELARAGMDISDGLSGDLNALCAESGVGARLDPSCLPIDPHAAALERARGGDPVALALHGGEDYQLLLSVPPERLEALGELAVVWDVAATVVGVCDAGAGGVLLEGGERLEPASHEHFRSRRGTREPAPDA